MADKFGKPMLAFYIQQHIIKIGNDFKMLALFSGCGRFANVVL